MKIPAIRIARIIAGAAAFVLFCGSAGDIFAQSATFEVKDDGGKKRKNITVVKDGEVLYSGPVGKRAAWLSGGEGDSVRGKIRSAFRGGDKNIRINATDNTVTIVIEGNDAGDSTRRFEMNITGDEFEGLGRNITRVFGNAFGEGGGSFHFNTRPFRDMARHMERSFHFSMPPRAPRAPRAPGFFWYNDGDEFESDKATQMAEEAKKLEREAAAMRKEAEAMRLESEAMRKRSEALRLEAEAQKKSKTDGGSKATKPADKKK
jgi:hypothetical protein